jgi:HAD superfamily hydrolase (TIGR01459 family)
MTPPKLIAGLAEVAGRYDAVLCDIWGVVHNGRRKHAAACEALVRFRTERGPVVLISNAPRPAGAVIEQLDRLGVPREAWSAVVTSGDATRAALADRAPGPVWWIGPERDRPLFDGVPIRFSGPEEAAFICCTGLIDDHVETAEDYRERLRGPAERGLLFVCANPDRVVQIGEALVPCAGAVADVYETMSGEVLMAGKPFAPIYDLALAAVAEAAGRAVERSRVLAIGDGVPTDVKGANAHALDLLFVAEGIHGEELAGADGLDPDKAAAMLRAADARADYLAPSLAWLSAGGTAASSPSAP